MGAAAADRDGASNQGQRSTHAAAVCCRRLAAAAVGELGVASGVVAAARLAYHLVILGGLVMRRLHAKKRRLREVVFWQDAIKIALLSKRKYWNSIIRNCSP